VKFTIINPSDPYTIECADLEIAAIACCLLGNGRYAFKSIDADAGAGVPLFLFGSPDPWFVEKFGMSYEHTAEHVLTHRTIDLANAFESVTLGRSERSSLNDIGGRARSIADAIRKRATELASDSAPGATGGES
jgi:hypothetical protein